MYAAFRRSADAPRTARRLTMFQSDPRLRLSPSPHKSPRSRHPKAHRRYWDHLGCRRSRAGRQVTPPRRTSFRRMTCRSRYHNGGAVGSLSVLPDRGHRAATAMGRRDAAAGIERTRVTHLRRKWAARSARLHRQSQVSSGEAGRLDHRQRIYHHPSFHLVLSRITLISTTHAP